MWKWINQWYGDGDNAWSRAKKQEKIYGGVVYWSGSGGKRAIYHKYRVNVGKDPLQFCNNSSSSGVWVYNTKYGAWCGCFSEMVGKNLDQHGTWEGSTYLGFGELVSDYQKKNAPGFFESLGGIVEYLGGCFDDYHCVLDLASIVVLAIPVYGTLISFGLDVVNSAAYGIEGLMAETGEEATAAYMAGALTFFGGFAGGGLKSTRRLLKAGQVNPNIYKYTSEVVEKMNKEFPNITKLKHAKDKNKLKKIYSDAYEKYGLTEAEKKISHDIMKVMKNISPEMVRKYAKAMKEMDSKIGSFKLFEAIEERGFKKILQQEGGDVITALNKYVKIPKYKEFLIQIGAFVGVQKGLQEPAVQQWISEKYQLIKYSGRKDIRGLVEKEGYDWNNTKQVFGSISSKNTDGSKNEDYSDEQSKKDNIKLKGAWKDGWRPWSEDLKSVEWLIDNPKWQTEIFKEKYLTKFNNQETKYEVTPGNEKDKKEGVKYVESKVIADAMNSEFKKLNLDDYR